MNKFLMMLQKHKMFHITGLSMSFLRDCEKKINNEIDWNFALKFIFCILFIFLFFIYLYLFYIKKEKSTGIDMWDNHFEWHKLCLVPSRLCYSEILYIYNYNIIYCALYWFISIYHSYSILLYYIYYQVSFFR